MRTLHTILIRVYERDHHTRSKIEAAQYAAAIGHKTKLAVTILRPGAVYAPGKPLPEAPLGFRAGNANVVLGKRKQHFALTYVENLADAIATVSARRGLRKFIVIDDEDLTLGQYHLVRKEVERTPTLFLPGLPLLFAVIGFEIAMSLFPLGFGAGNQWRRIQLQLQDRRFDTRRIREETGWAPQVSLKDAIRHTLQYPPVENLTDSRHCWKSTAICGVWMRPGFPGAPKRFERGTLQHIT